MTEHLVPTKYEFLAKPPQAAIIGALAMLLLAIFRDKKSLGSDGSAQRPIVSRWLWTTQAHVASEHRECPGGRPCCRVIELVIAVIDGRRNEGLEEDNGLHPNDLRRLA